MPQRCGMLGIPRSEQDQIGKGPARPYLPGRLLEGAGNRTPRGMTIGAPGASQNPAYRPAPVGKTPPRHYRGGVFRCAAPCPNASLCVLRTCAPRPLSTVTPPHRSRSPSAARQRRAISVCRGARPRASRGARQASPRSQRGTRRTSPVRSSCCPSACIP